MTSAALRHDAVDIEVDRHRMAQPLQAREPQRRQLVARPAARPRPAPTGRCRRRTARRCRPATGRGRRRSSASSSSRELGRQQMHGLQAAMIRRCDGLPGRGPSRRSRRAGPARASPGAQGRSNWCWKRVPDALHQQPHRLAGDVDEALDAQDVVRRRRRRRGGRPAPAAASKRRQVDDEAVEVVVVVLVLGVVMRRPRWRDRPRPRRRGRAARGDRRLAVLAPRPPSRRAARSRRSRP